MKKQLLLFIFLFMVGCGTVDNKNHLNNITRMQEMNNADKRQSRAAGLGSGFGSGLGGFGGTAGLGGATGLGGSSGLGGSTGGLGGSVGLGGSTGGLGGSVGLAGTAGLGGSTGLGGSAGFGGTSGLGGSLSLGSGIGLGGGLGGGLGVLGSGLSGAGMGAYNPFAIYNKPPYPTPQPVLMSEKHKAQINNVAKIKDTINSLKEKEAKIFASKSLKDDTKKAVDGIMKLESQVDLILRAVNTSVASIWLEEGILDDAYGILKDMYNTNRDTILKDPVVEAQKKKKQSGGDATFSTNKKIQNTGSAGYRTSTTMNNMGGGLGSSATGYSSGLGMGGSSGLSTGTSYSSGLATGTGSGSGLGTGSGYSTGSVGSGSSLGLNNSSFSGNISFGNTGFSSIGRF